MPFFGLLVSFTQVFLQLLQIFWVITVIVTLKYVTLAVQADDNGEGAAEES